MYVLASTEDLGKVKQYISPGEVATVMLWFLLQRSLVKLKNEYTKSAMTTFKS